MCVEKRQRIVSVCVRISVCNVIGEVDENERVVYVCWCESNIGCCYCHDSDE